MRTLNITLLATDQQRSVIQAIDRRSSGSIAYTPYGYHCKKSTSMCRLGFNGEFPEASTGDYLLGNGYRAFNPVLMRFNSPDKLSPFGKGGVNTYAYCLGDPINRSDESGRFSAPWIANASTTYIKSRHALIARTPWYSWSGRDIELVKHSTRQSPFGMSKLQPKELFGIQTSSKRFSPAPAVKRPRLFPEEMPVIIAQPDDGNFNNTLMERFYETRVHKYRKDALLHFIKTPRAGHIEQHSNKLRSVMFDLEESFEVVEGIGLVPSPSNIKAASRLIRNENLGNN